jgi:lipid-A-disaccharide synthase-like uncharacterized protein
MDEWRILLYYPLGLLPAVFFGLRVLVQWIQSERAGESIVPALFWKLSLAGNLLSVAHYFIQLQFPFALFQTVNAFISWRNLDLMRPKESLSTKSALKIFILCLIGLTISFVAVSMSFEGTLLWSRVPKHGWQHAAHVSFMWHVIGTLGQGLFASRFWVQWWLAEKNQRSSLGTPFWWLCIVGNFISLLYFVRIDDTVSLFNNIFSIIPAIRNLLLIARKDSAMQ